MAALWKHPKSFLIGSLALLCAATSAPAADDASVEAVIAGNDCSGCDLTGAVLMGIHGDDRNFSFSNISGGDLYRVILPGANFAGAVLTDVNFRKSDLGNADFQGAMLSGANLEGANLEGAALGGALTDELTYSDETTICPDGSSGPCDF
ncbi:MULTISPECIES: pentapeptide repeat-containing protein [unclassified Marinovum]